METAITESEQLANLEAEIEAGQKTFLSVGNALAEIRDKKLYASKRASFEEYLEIRWGFKRTYANHIIRAAETIKALPAEAATIVATESQARELAKVDKGLRMEVLTKAQEIASKENRPLAARDITAAAPIPVKTPTTKQPQPVAAKDATTQPPVAPSYSLKSLYADLDGLAEIVLAEFNLTDQSHAAGHFEMLSAKIRRSVRERKSA